VGHSQHPLRRQLSNDLAGGEKLAKDILSLLQRQRGHFVLSVASRPADPDALRRGTASS
jgi:hypothetical protein